MTQFQEGQEVEVQCNEYEGEPLWRRGAKILCYAWPADKDGPEMYDVEFSDGASGVFDVNHIRAA